MPNEVSVHAQEYGFGGSFFEDEFFDTDDEEEEDLKPLMKPEWDGDENNDCCLLERWSESRPPRRRVTSSDVVGATSWIHRTVSSVTGM